MTQDWRNSPFWINVHIGNDKECWPWKLATNEAGYGVVTINRKQYRAHRKALSIFLGRPLHSDMNSLHDCDNPPCCNPFHLYEGTNSDNMQDRVRRGRQPANLPPRPGKGDKCWNTKIPDSEISIIRTSVRNAAPEFRSSTLDRLALQYKVTRTRIRQIANGDRT